MKKKAAAPKKRASKKAKSPSPPVPQIPQWYLDALATNVLAPPAPVSVPGGPSAHPDRTPVPPPPTGAEAFIGANFLGRAPVLLSQYRPPPVQEGGAEIDMCAGCDVDCCSGHVIPINCFDAWRIKSVLNIPFRDFLGLVPWVNTAPTHAVRIQLAKFSLVLRRRSDRSCGFLIKVGNERRCGIHALRPDACRIFPFVPDAEMQQKQPGHSMLQIHPSSCPWLWPSTPEHKARVQKDIADNAEHRVVDREVLSTWFWAIGVEKTVENFYTFLEDELPRRMLRPDEKSKYITTLW